MDLTTIIPVKGFGVAKVRLSAGFRPLDRALIATATAGHVIETCVRADTHTLVVTDDAAVAALAAELGASVIDDPGGGLDAAVAAGMGAARGPWAVLHADLPLLDERIVRVAADHLAAGSVAIAPARDGGTNLLGAVEPFETAYGPGSFHRHLGRLARFPVPIRVLVDEALAIEIDTPRDLEVAAGRPGGRWLAPFLS